MQQTMFALVALLIATLLSFNQKQAAVQHQQQVFQAEMTQMALGVANHAVQIVRARAFDVATAGVTSDSIVATSNFTETPFITGYDCQPFGGGDTCNDIDDFHEMVTATVPFDYPGGSFDFDVDIEIKYVDSNLQPTGGTRTSRKKIIVKVQDDPASGGSPRLPEPIEYSEVVSYP